MLPGISNLGNKAQRTFFIHGARAILSKPEKAVAVFGECMLELRSRRPFNVAIFALANKLVRIACSPSKHLKYEFNPGQNDQSTRLKT